MFDETTQNLTSNPYFFNSFEPRYRYLFRHKSESGYYPLEDGKNFTQLQYNKANKFLQYIIIDCDNDDYIKILQNENVPIPNYIIKNNHKVGGHLFFILERPILKSLSFDYFADIFFDIFKTLTSLFNGDKQHKGYIGKNYLNGHYFSHKIMNEHLYNLFDLKDLLKICNDKKIEKNLSSHNGVVFQNEINKFKKPFLNVDLEMGKIGTRNKTMFDELRKFAYIVYRDKTLKTLLLNRANDINLTFEIALPLTELTATINSIYKYVKSDKFKGLKKQPKKLKLGEDLTIQEKEKAGAEYTNKLQVEKSKIRIELAIKEMKKLDENINIKSLARKLNMSKNTIKKYKDLFEDLRTD